MISLTATLFSEKVLISARCISELMPSLIKKSWTDSTFETFPPKIPDYRRNKIEAPSILKLTKTALKGVQNVQNIFLKGVQKIAQKSSKKFSKKLKIVQNVQKNLHKIVQKVDQKNSKEGQKIVKIIKKFVPSLVKTKTIKYDGL